MPELIGNRPILEALRNLIHDKKFPTSLLISGPRGSGKKTSAKVLARALNCELAHFNEPCSCHACHKTELGIHPDVRWYGLDEEAYSIKIDEIHHLINWAGYKVLEGKKKIFIVNRAERMTEEAANALLKTLEEPPADSLIFLLVENPAHLRETLVSRCFSLKMQVFSCGSIEKILTEHFEWSRKDASWVAKYSRGRLGQALEMKNENFSEVRKRFLEEVLPNPVEGFERWVGRKRHEVLKDLESLTLLLRDLVVYRETQDHHWLYQEELNAQFREWSQRLSTESILKILGLIDETQTSLQENVNPKIALFRLATAIKDLYEKNLLSDHTSLLR